jgi:hypothetical protein
MLVTLTFVTSLHPSIDIMLGDDSTISVAPTVPPMFKVGWPLLMNIVMKGGTPQNRDWVIFVDPVWEEVLVEPEVLFAIVGELVVGAPGPPGDGGPAFVAPDPESSELVSGRL